MIIAVMASERSKNMSEYEKKMEQLKELVAWFHEHTAEIQAADDCVLISVLTKGKVTQLGAGRANTLAQVGYLQAEKMMKAADEIEAEDIIEGRNNYQ